MNEENAKNWKESVEHPSEDDLLCFIDGELSPKATDSLRSHLEACWQCRNRAEKFQAAISLFVDYRSQMFLPAIDGPNNRQGFNARLRDQAAEMMPPTIWQRLRLSFPRFRIQLPRVETRTARLATISAFTVLLAFAGAYFLFISSPTIVSAEELINLAAASRERELKSAEQPVLYQQLRVIRRNNQGEKVSNVEIWQDVENLRLRQVAQDRDAEPASLSDLEEILKANKYAPPPMSIVNFRAWRAGLAEKRDSVEEIRNAGNTTLKLRTEVPNATNAGQLVASTLFLRAADYHPIEQHFRVMTTDGEQTFEIRETSFAVMSLNSLNPGFFADSQPMVVQQSSPPYEGGVDDASSDGVVLSSAANSNANTATATAPTAIATAELEVEVMNALHSAGADLGEQIEVRRSPNGPINVTGVVETPQRKNEILNALNELKNNPAVRIQISTVSEAIAAEKGNKARPQPSVENIQVDTDSYPAEGDLLAHFGDAGKARSFAARMTGQSSRAMNYLWAMKRLKGQFGGSQVAKLTPEARSKLLNVVRSYAASYQREVGVLRRELSSVFGGGGGGGQAGRITTDAELLAAIDQLFAAASGSNQVVRTAFLTSGSGTNALKTAQFWQMLTRAEALAESIERYK